MGERERRDFPSSHNPSINTSTMVAAKSKKKSPKPSAPKAKKSKTEEVIQEDILQAIDAISDESDDEDAGQVIEDASDEEDNEQWDAEALALRQMISDGKFNDLLKHHEKKGKRKQEAESEEKEVAEEELDSDDASEQDDSHAEEKDDEESESSDDDDDKEEQQKAAVQDTRATALKAAIQSSNRHLPFAESFAVVPPTPLPFGSRAASKSIAVGVDDDNDKGAVDVHDDLKREVAFYDTALEAVNIARGECEKVGIPFTRPDDFFAEMIKTDGELLDLSCCSFCNIFWVFKGW